MACGYGRALQNGWNGRRRDSASAPRSPGGRYPHVIHARIVNSISAGDITTLLERNGKPVAIINMSFTVAKTLSVALGQIVAQIEERSGRNMLTTHELAKLLEGSGEK
jgi:hypothetical protein